MWLVPPFPSGFRLSPESRSGGGNRSFSYQSPTPAATGTPRYENEAWSLEVFVCRGCHPSPLDSGLRRNDEAGGRNDENAERRGSTARSKAA